MVEVAHEDVPVNRTEHVPVNRTEQEVYPKASPTEETSEEAMPDASDRATPIEKDHRGESRAENVQGERPQLVDNVMERQIGGKVFKLGRFLS